MSCLGLGVGQCEVWDHIWGAKFKANWFRTVSRLGDYDKPMFLACCKQKTGLGPGGGSAPQTQANYRHIMEIWLRAEPGLFLFECFHFYSLYMRLASMDSDFHMVRDPFRACVLASGSSRFSCARNAVIYNERIKIELPKRISHCVYACKRDGEIFSLPCIL